jgi:hypothetical protein
MEIHKPKKSKAHPGIVAKYVKVRMTVITRDNLLNAATYRNTESSAKDFPPEMDTAWRGRGSRGGARRFRRSNPAFCGM